MRSVRGSERECVQWAAAGTGAARFERFRRHQMWIGRWRWRFRCLLAAGFNRSGIGRSAGRRTDGINFSNGDVATETFFAAAVTSLIGAIIVHFNFNNRSQVRGRLTTVDQQINSLVYLLFTLTISKRMWLSVKELTRHRHQRRPDSTDWNGSCQSLLQTDWPSRRARSDTSPKIVKIKWCENWTK